MRDLITKDQAIPEPERSTELHCSAAEAIAGLNKLVHYEPAPPEVKDDNSWKMAVIAPYRLTWPKTPIKEVKYNIHIKALMDYDPAFSAWVRSMVMVHSDQNAFETVCTVPDQWSDRLQCITLITAGKSLERNRLLEAMPGHYIHVMIGSNKNLND